MSDGPVFSFEGLGYQVALERVLTEDATAELAGSPYSTVSAAPDPAAFLVGPAGSGILSDGGEVPLWHEADNGTGVARIRVGDRIYRLEAAASERTFQIWCESSDGPDELVDQRWDRQGLDQPELESVAFQHFPAAAMGHDPAGFEPPVISFDHARFLSDVEQAVAAGRPDDSYPDPRGYLWGPSGELVYTGAPGSGLDGAGTVPLWTEDAAGDLVACVDVDGGSVRRITVAPHGFDVVQGEGLTAEVVVSRQLPDSLPVAGRVDEAFETFVVSCDPIGQQLVRRGPELEL